MIEKVPLQVVDYVVIVVTLAVPLAIGVFFSVRDRNKLTRDEYLLGGRSMSMLPVALSLFVTFQSAISLIGSPSELYLFGPRFIGFGLGISLSFIVAYYTLTPLMYPLKLTSIYEYLQIRFESRFVRLLSTASGMLQTFFYMVVALLAPGLALEAAADIPLWISVVIVGGIGVLYTSAGGIKSVIWTDAFQTLIVMVGIVTVIVKSCFEIGGVEKVWNINQDGGRTDFRESSFDPRIRHTWFGVILGAVFTWMTNLFSQSTVQRLSSLSSLRKARQVMIINIFTNLLYALSLLVTGWCLYAYLFNINCDPFVAGLVQNRNQVTPFFVIHVMQGLPGMAGLYMGALFSGALSTLSSGINSLAANTIEDILKNRLKSVSERTVTIVTKVVVLIYGVAIIVLVYLAKNLTGTVTEMSASVFGTFGSCVLGMFTMGCTIPWANKYGAMCGGVTALIVNLWIAIGGKLYGRKLPILAPVPSDQCLNSTLSVNAITLIRNTTTEDTFIKESQSSEEFGFFLYDISYEWYTIIGTVSCFTVGLIVSRLTRTQELTTSDPRLILPCLRKFWNVEEVIVQPDIEFRESLINNHVNPKVQVMSREK